MTDLYCTACDRPLSGPAQLCEHTNPVGFWCCCHDEHHPGHNDEESAA
jgi:hypothetical protein